MPGGVVLFIFGVATGGVFLAILGVLSAVGGVGALMVTQKGAIWDGLQSEEKLMAFPGIAAGAFFFLFYAVIIGIMAFIGSVVGKK
ncbi:hypothetical protein DRB96_03725 [Streptomyces sp. ICC1]|nr:hypothetical protein DRB89_11375 [Streptomyces sp. ICC4]AWZ11567.1 hypothetical protein DRB96_03725 [Streptomyces sp. ICC1]